MVSTTPPPHGDRGEGFGGVKLKTVSLLGTLKGGLYTDPLKMGLHENLSERGLHGDCMQTPLKRGFHEGCMQTPPKRGLHDNPSEK